MSIPTLRTFTGDTYLNGDDLAWNFETIKTAINGGIVDADISTSAGFSLSQVAQNSAIQFLSFSKIAGATATFTLPVMFDCEVYDASLLIKRSDSADAAAIGYVIDGTGSSIVKVVLNTATDEVGYKEFNPRIQLKANTFYAIQIVADSNVSFASFRLGIVSKHTKR